MRRRAWTTQSHIARRTWLSLLGVCLLGIAPASADDALAKERFEQGVQAGRAGRWEEAIVDLEASLAEHAKPATRYNLVLAYHKLERPLDVARHALLFLRQYAEADREGARAHVTEFLGGASRQLAMLDTSALLPSGAQPLIDGNTPSAVDGTFVYVLPGPHVLEATFGHEKSEAVHVTLVAGQVLSWPLPTQRADIASTSSHHAHGSASASRSALSTPMKAALLPAPQPLWRKRAAWITGVTGAALLVAGAACLWVAEARAGTLASGGKDGTTVSGYLSAAERYRDSLRGVVPLALAGGVTGSVAAVVMERPPRRGELVWSAASLVLGAGLLGIGGFFVFRDPTPVIASATYDRPSRERGALMLGASLPFIAYGAVSLTRERRVVSLAAGPGVLRGAW
jgi:hypothetical protein